MKIFWISFIVSIILWSLPFVIRLFFLQLPEVHIESSKLQPSGTNQVVSEIFQSVKSNDRWNAFYLIFKNNLNGCVLNILGGVLLGLGTVFNLLINGFYTADVFATTYHSGVSLQKIVTSTLPHSIELIGFWLSGAIGFYIAKLIVDLMREKAVDYLKALKTIGVSTFISFTIILIAAWIEAFISIQ